MCEVTDGELTYQVVCGAPNVRAGLKVPFARVGAVIGEDFKIKQPNSEVLSQMACCVVLTS